MSEAYKARKTRLDRTSIDAADRNLPRFRPQRLALSVALAVMVAAILRQGVVSGSGQTSPATTAQAPTRASDFNVFEKTIPELQAAMQAGTITARELVEQYRARIRAYDQAGPTLRAFIALNPHALDDAAALDAERRTRGPRGPLHGIPIAIKDNYATVELPMTGGSRALAGFEPRRDAFLVKKLRDAGAIIIGKTNLHELGYGITTISSMGGQTRNPYDPERNPGGSSGGTGAAVAASLVAAGMGTDTCGSIRNPASSNNLVGLRGTMGLSSRDGIIPLSHTQDIGGPLARSVTDLTIMLDATVGPDAADSVTRAGEGHIPRSYREALGSASLTGERVGVLASLFGSMPEDAEVAGVVRHALDAMRAHGADVIDIKVPGLDALMQNTSVIAAEFKFDLSDFLSRFPSAPVHSLGEIIDGGQYDPAVEAVFTRANAAQSRYDEAYRQALARREAVRKAIVSTLRDQHLTALAFPTLRRKPARIKQAQAGSNCQLSATTALPAMSIPAGFSEDGVPIGMELLGDAFTETELLKLAYAYEQAIRPRRPPSVTPPLPD